MTIAALAVDGQETAPVCALSGPRVLVVEDDPEVVAFLNKLLLYLGYQVFHVPDGAQAIQWLRRDLPDVIFTDVMMPHMDGLHFCKAVRQDPRTSLIPVIMLSARAELQERLDGFRAGADDYIIKPFDVLELKARLESILLRSEREIWCNPISHLPGSPGIEAEVNHRLKIEQPFAFAYIDIDDFKAYNDVYGFHAGDQVIKDLGVLLMKFSITNALTQTFCGHIGGDDFVFLSAPAYMALSLPRLLQRFDAAVPSYCSAEHCKKGGITAPNRQEQSQFFPLMRLSAAVVNTATRRITHYAQLAEIASELKHHIKATAVQQNAPPALRKSRSLWDGRKEPPKDILS
jgi:DNA-binding response OmpR family regulator